MKLKALVLALFIVCSLTQAQGVGGSAGIGGKAGFGADPFLLPSVLPASACFALGAASPKTTSAIDTTGAKIIVVSVSFQSGTGPIVVTDNKSNGNATALTAYQSTNGVSSQIFYWLNPTAGSGHTFTVTGVGTYYSSTCVQLIANIAGVFDSGTDQGQGTLGGITCSPSTAINPGVGAHMLVSTVGINGGAPSINSSFVIDSTVGFSSGANYGTGAAHLVQSPGVSVQPTWTLASGNGTCAIASFH